MLPYIYASVGNYRFLVVTSRAPINIKSGEGAPGLGRLNIVFLVLTSRAPINIKSEEGAPGLVRLNIVWTQHRDGWRGINSQKTTAQLEHIDSIVDI